MLYQEVVTRLQPVTKMEEIDVPDGLVKLVNGNDPEFGRNGHHYIACERKRQGGYTIDRLHSYVQHHNFYHVRYGHPCNCPL